MTALARADAAGRVPRTPALGRKRPFVQSASVVRHAVLDSLACCWIKGITQRLASADSAAGDTVPSTLAVLGVSRHRAQAGVVLLRAAQHGLALEDVVHALGSDPPVNDGLLNVFVGHDGELVTDAKLCAAWPQVAHEPGNDRSVVGLGYFEWVLTHRHKVAVQATWQRRGRG